MQIKKEYHFYGGHRNETLKDKCCHLHGHDYKVFCHFHVVRNGDISTLFDEFDRVLEPMFKNEFDHRLLINKKDPLYKNLLRHEGEQGEDLGLAVLPFPTSVENLCCFFFGKIREHFPNLVQLEIQETRSSTVAYTAEDYQKDREHFSPSGNFSGENKDIA